MSFFKRFQKREEPKVEEAPPIPPPPPSRAKGFVPPPPRTTAVVDANPTAIRLEKRRQALEDAIEQVERAGDPDSSYQQRVAILGETLDSIEQDIQAAIPLPHETLPGLPETPIERISVVLEPVPDVAFTIGSTDFRYTEEIDWGERGTTVIRGYLVPISVDIEPLIPASMTGSIRERMHTHLDRSLSAFAANMRDRTVEGEPLPVPITLADLARPCPRCGGWQLWGGLCIRCLEHETRLRNLNIERTRVLDERTAELEERQRQVEELPLQRRKLAQTIAAIEQLES